MVKPLVDLLWTDLLLFCQLLPLLFRGIFIDIKERLEMGVGALLVGDSGASAGQLLLRHDWQRLVGKIEA